MTYFHGDRPVELSRLAHGPTSEDDQRAAEAILARMRGPNRCPDHDLAEPSHDPNGEPTGDYYCPAPRCEWVALIGHGYDEDDS